MARRGGRSSNRKNQRISSAMSPPIARQSLLRNPIPFTNYEDQRQWTPRPIGPISPLPKNYATSSRTAKRISSPKWRPGYAVSFAEPRNVFICVRRKRRKEVMFARRKAGKSGTGRAKKRRNFWSQVRC